MPNMCKSWEHRPPQGWAELLQIWKARKNTHLPTTRCTRPPNPSLSKGAIQSKIGYIRLLKGVCIRLFELNFKSILKCIKNYHSEEKLFDFDIIPCHILSRTTITLQWIAWEISADVTVITLLQSQSTAGLTLPMVTWAGSGYSQLSFSL